MSNATVSYLGKINNAGDQNALLLKLWSGEVLASFQQENKLMDLTTVRTISQGKSAQFPVTGTIASSYHTPGAEILGTVVSANEKIITIDDVLISHAFISDIDEAKNHYDVRSIYTKEMGHALATTVDKHLLQLGVLGARASATITGGTGGSVITDADANTNMTSLIDSIFEGAEDLDNANVPSEDRYCIVAPDIYYELVQNDKLLNRDFQNANGDYGQGTIINVAGIKIIKCNSATASFTDLSSASTTGQNNTYRGNFATTVACLFHKSGIGSVKLRDLAIEKSYDPRRLGTLMVAKMMIGSNFLRPEACVEIKTA
jgi:hypothetical protein